VHFLFSLLSLTWMLSHPPQMSTVLPVPVAASVLQKQSSSSFESPPFVLASNAKQGDGRIPSRKRKAPEFDQSSSDFSTSSSASYASFSSSSLSCSFSSSATSSSSSSASSSSFITPKRVQPPRKWSHVKVLAWLETGQSFPEFCRWIRTELADDPESIVDGASLLSICSTDDPYYTWFDRDRLLMNCGVDDAEERRRLLCAIERLKLIDAQII
jgi:hypothetical protein